MKKFFIYLNRYAWIWAVGIAVTIIVIFKPGGEYRFHSDKTSDCPQVYVAHPKLHAYVNTFVINGGTFDQDVYVVIADDTAVARYWVRKVIDSVTTEDFSGSGATFPYSDGMPVVMWLESGEDKAVVQHEMLHATSFIMTWAGVSFSDDTEEVYAYELQYLTKQFYEKTKK